MNKLSLCFPTFYYCVIKENSHLPQYQTVSILLTGKERPAESYDKSFISDSTVTNYIKGRKTIRDNILTPLLRSSSDQIIERLKRLDFQSIRPIALAAMNLVAEAANINSHEKSALYERYKDSGKEYDFVAAVFLTALRCPPNLMTVIDASIEKRLCDIRVSRPQKYDFQRNLPLVSQLSSNYDSFSENIIDETDMYDVSESVNILLTRISYPYDYANTVAYFNLSQNIEFGVLSLDVANIDSVFSYGTQNYDYFLTTVSGPSGDMTTALDQFKIFVDSPAMLILLEYNNEITIDAIDSLSFAIQSQIQHDTRLFFGTLPRNEFPPSVCKIKILYSKPKKR